MAESSSYPTCSDLSDVKPLWKRNGLYLKPLVKVKISVQLPVSKSTDYAISNHALMEAIRELARPDVFCSIKTTKTTVDVVKFEAELEKPSSLRWVISRIDGETVKLRGHKDAGKIRACAAKNDFPTRHDWDSFFRDSKHMNELKAGERPDTIHIQDVPVEWFVTERSNGRPNEKFICRVFEQFGAISAVDIPSNDPYRSQMRDHISGMKQFNFSTTNLFETYVQFKDYLSFVAAMDALRGMKLLKKDDGQARTQVIKVDFDRSKHLSESSIRKRKVLREKLMEKERQKEEQCEKVVDNVVRTRHARSESPKEPERTERSEEDEEEHVSSRKILREENLLTTAHRKLESIRLLSELLERVADKKRINEGSRMDRKVKQKSVVSLPNQLMDKKANDRSVPQEELGIPVYKSDALCSQPELISYGRTEVPISIYNLPPGSYANRAYLDNGGVAPNNDSSSSNETYFQHRGGQNWRGRGQPFYNQRGRFMRNRGTYTPMGHNSWGHYNSQSDGYQRNGYNNRGGYSFNNQKGSSTSGSSNFRNHQDFGRNFLDDRRDQQLDGRYDAKQYIKYFMNLAKLVNTDDRERYSRSRSRSRRRSRSRSRHRSRSRSRYRSRTRSRSRSHRRHSRSRTRSRSRSRRRTKSRSRSQSRRRTKSRSRSRSRRRSSSRSRSKSHRQSRFEEKSRSRERSKSRRRSESHKQSDSKERSKHRGRSKSEERSKTRERSKSRRRSKSVDRRKSDRRTKSRSPSKARDKNAKSRSRSQSWTDVRSRSRSRSWSQTKTKTSSYASKNRGQSTSSK